jgi:hypothetical protein
MPNEKYRRLVDGLLTKTDRHELDWKATAEPTAFQVSLRQFSIIFSEETRYRTAQQGFFTNSIPYKIKKFSILNPEGEEVDSFTDRELPDAQREEVSALYVSVRRQALGVDKALDEILEELGSR